MMIEIVLYLVPTNHAEYHTRILPSAFGGTEEHFSYLKNH